MGNGMENNIRESSLNSGLDSLHLLHMDALGRSIHLLPLAPGK